MGVITPIFFYATSKSIISVGDSVAMGIIYQLGLLCGTTVGGHYYAKLKKDHNEKALLLRKLNFLSTGCGISLGFFSLIAQNNSSGFMLFLEATLAFLMAFGVSTSYYVIPDSRCIWWRKTGWYGISIFRLFWISIYIDIFIIKRDYFFAIKLVRGLVFDRIFQFYCDFTCSTIRKYIRTFRK